MNNTNQNNFAKIAGTLFITTISIVTITIGYLVVGCIFGGILHPSSHKHNFYSWACDSHAILTETEALILGIIFIVIYLIALNAILRVLKFSNATHIIALILILIANSCVVYIGADILTTQATG